MKKSRRNPFVLLGLPLTVLFAVAFVPGASAQPSIVPSISLTVDGMGQTFNYAQDPASFQAVQSSDMWELSAPETYMEPGAVQLTVQELRYANDPIVYNSILVQNIAASVQTYTFGVSLATTWTAPNSIRGSIDTSLIGTDAQVASVAGVSIYTAMIDFAAVRTLQDAPFMLTTPQDAVSASDAFGYDLSNIAVNSSIGIQLRFSLSPGDTATIVSDFEVVDVIPEPGTMALLLLGGSLLIWRRRRS